MVGTIERALAKTARAAEWGADLIEFRIDRFYRDPERVGHLVAESPLPCILTCRLPSEGGHFDGEEADRIHKAIKQTRIMSPPTDCIAPIGEDLILAALKAEVDADFYSAVTRRPTVYRGNPFLIEVGLAYGGQATAKNVTRPLLVELIEESDARTIRQFLINTFNGLGTEAADKIIKVASLGTRQSPSRLKKKEIDRLLGPQGSYRC